MAQLTAPATKRILHPGSIGMLIGGILTVVGSVLPWVSTPAGSLSGLSGPGLWTLCAGFIGVAGALLPYRKLAIFHCLAAGGAIAIIAGWQVVRLVELSSSTGSWGSMFPGIGLVLAAGGAVVLLRTGYRLIRTPARIRRRRARSVVALARVAP